MAKVKIEQVRGVEAARRMLSGQSRETADAIIKDFLPRIELLASKYGDNPIVLKTHVDLLLKELAREMQLTAARHFIESFDAGQSAIARAFRVEATSRDRAYFLLTTPQLQKGFRAFQNDTQKKAAKAFTESFDNDKGFSLERLKDNLGEVVDAAEGNINTIARTETNRFFQAGRREGYKQAERALNKTFLYAWGGPAPHNIDPRTTPCCSRIMERVANAGGAVPWNELVSIVREESAQDFPTFSVEPEAPTAHWNCRHFAIRNPAAEREQNGG